MPYEVHLDVFDGPFAVLLELITAQRVDLYEVRLTDIVDGFLAELARREALDLEAATEFLLIAATLVELKCRRLLPGGDDVDLDEELALFEARDYLLARLVECKTFQSAAEVLAALEQAAARSFPRRSGPDERLSPPAVDLLAGVTAEQVRAAARKALAPRPVERVAVGHVHDDVVSMHAVYDELCRRLPGEGRTSFAALTAGAPTTAHVVACFLALLELYKQELVELEQLTTFGELAVVWQGGAATPAGGTAMDDYDELATSSPGPGR